MNSIREGWRKVAVATPHGLKTVSNHMVDYALTCDNTLTRCNRAYCARDPGVATATFRHPWRHPTQETPMTHHRPVDQPAHITPARVLVETLPAKTTLRIALPADDEDAR